MPMHQFRSSPAVGMMLTALALIANACPASAQSPAPNDLAKLRQDALAAVNKSRAAHHLPALKLGAKLDTVAQNHANDMYEHHYYAHTSPQGVTVQDRYLKAGGSKWELIAENIARCKGCQPPATKAIVERLQDDWMHSPEHRANILHRGLTGFGYGIVLDKNQGLYAVQTFAGPGVPRGIKAGETAAAIPAKQQARDALTLINAARKGAGVSPLARSPALTKAAQKVLPKPRSGTFALKQDHSIYDALPQGANRHFSSIATLEAACGGCGTKPTKPDVRYFVRQWLGD
ncbi:MAG TPA: CAP domain-containing protein, partial [Pseudolabrys sp.]|nr:CAP domain-containing protein [Pseudolabrys sp.]